MNASMSVIFHCTFVLGVYKSYWSLYVSVSWHFLKLLTFSRIFPVEFFRYLKCNIMSSEKGGCLSSNCTPLVYSCLIIPASASSTILKRNGDKWKPCLVPNCNGLPQVFLFKITLAVSSTYIALLCWDISPLVLLSLDLWHESTLDFIKNFLRIYWDDCLLSSFMWFITFIDVCVELLIMPNWSWWIIYLLCEYFYWEILILCLSGILACSFLVFLVVVVIFAWFWY